MNRREELIKESQSLSYKLRAGTCQNKWGTQWENFCEKGEGCCSEPGLNPNRVSLSETIRALGVSERREGTGGADIEAATPQLIPRTSHTSEALLQPYLARDK